MPTSLISNFVLDNAGQAVSDALAIIDLIPGPAFRKDTGSEIKQVTETQTGLTGQWQASLERSSNIDPVTSYYRVREMLPKTKGGTKTWYFYVPDYDAILYNCLTVPSTADSLIRPVVVTSGGKPTNPYVGMQIFETDTGRVLYYYGASLGWRPNWGLSWGEISGVSYTTDFSTASATPVDTGASTTAVQVIPGRQYLTTVSCWMELSGAAATFTLGLYDQTDTLLNSRNFQTTATSAVVPMELYHREAAVSTFTNISRKLKISTTAGTVKLETSNQWPANISIIDVGSQAPPVIT